MKETTFSGEKREEAIGHNSVDTFLHRGTA
jgi:hypothetical protein